MDQTLDSRFHESLAEHVRSCRACSRLILEVQEVRQKLADIPLLPVPKGLVERILEKTSGRPRKRSLWADMALPTVKPFLTQRYAFGTGIMLVFLLLFINMLGPTFSALGYSDLSPSAVVENADRFTDHVKMKWAQAKVYQAKVVEEARLVKEDLYGRLDYYLINLLFSSYRQSVQEEQKTEEQPKQEGK